MNDVLSVKLSNNTEQHIRKHYREFGYKERNSFTREKIIEQANSIVNNAVRVFQHRTKHDDALIFYDGIALLIVSVPEHSIKTMFVLNEKEYLKRKLERNYWKEINLKDLMK